MKLFKLMRRLLLIIIVLSILIGAYYTYALSPTAYSFNQTDFQSEKINDDLNGFTVAYLSDIHLAKDDDIKRLETIIKELNEHPFDMLIFGGDLYDSDVFSNKEVTSILKNIYCKYGKFAVLGEKDEIFEGEVTQILNESGFEVIKDECRMMYYKNSPFQFIASSFDSDLSKMNIRNDLFTLSVSHMPDSFQSLKEVCDLQISGHSLGGQIYIPYLGSPIKTDGASKYYHGTYLEDGATLLVSNGISPTSKFPYKVLTKNHVELITIKK